MTNEKLVKARSLLISKEPWYGHAAMVMSWFESERTSTMGVRIVDGEVQCLYNPGFVESLSVEELFGAIQHEIEHVVRCHCIRGCGSSPRAWNVAIDMCVNGPYDNPRIGCRMPLSGELVIPMRDRLVWIPAGWPAFESAEYYFSRLPKDGRPGRVTGEPLDDHSIWEQSTTSSGELQSAARYIATSATTETNGRVPHHLEDTVRRLTKPSISWRTLLRRYLSNVARGRRSAYSRRNRRRDMFGIPGSLPRQGGKVSIIVDISGSVTRDQLSQFFTEIESICSHAKVSVLLWDDCYQGFVPEYRHGDWQTIPLPGRGGTDMVAPVRWLVEHGKVGDCVVMLTDGWCEWPPRQPFDFVAAISANPATVSGPEWGKVVYLEN